MVAAGCCDEEEEGEGEGEGEVVADGEADEAGETDGGGVGLSRSSELVSTLALGVGDAVVAGKHTSSSTVELMLATEGEHVSSSERKAMRTAMLSARRCLLFHLLNASLMMALTTSLG